MNQGKDHTKKTAQAIMTAKAGAFMGINSMRSILYFMQAGNDISRSRITESFFAFENFTRYVYNTVIYYQHKLNSLIISLLYFFTLHFFLFRSEPKVKWSSRQGLVPDEVSYFPSMSYGKNTYETFIFSGVVVLTDAYLPIRELTGKQPCFISSE